MNSEYNIQGLGKWELVYTGSHIKTNNELNINVDFPVLFSSPLLLISTSTKRIIPTWYTAGYLTQYALNIDFDDNALFPGLNTSSSGVADIRGWRLPLYVSRVYQVEPLVPEYGLFLSVKKWIPDITIRIMEYRE
ncbi:MAG: hypothetical protein F6K31_31335 [Symploca sp. SIO2G7]|nr:hypothetical protein [Symploca sp. SIO2G7]